MRSACGFQWHLMSKYDRDRFDRRQHRLQCVADRTADSGASVEWFALTSVIQMLTNYSSLRRCFFIKAKTRLWVSITIAKRCFRAAGTSSSRVDAGCDRAFRQAGASGDAGEAMARVL